jgi:hypothetical protein
VGHLAVGIHGRRIAAVLALGDAAVLSHRSAAAAWRLRANAGTLLDLAEVLPAQATERAIEAAEGLRLFDLAAVERVIEAHPARH